MEAEHGGMTWRRMRILGVFALVLGLLGALGYVTARAHSQSRAQLEDRFALRATLAASFTSSYAQSVVRAERRQAERLLAGSKLTERRFLDVVAALEFDAALLLDSRGRVLHSWPAKPELIGSDLRGKYEHLRVAVAGTPGVSNVVLSAVEGKPVVAFAAPFQSSEGRRVLSGAFGLDGTALGVFLETTLPIQGAELALIDSSGMLLIDSGTTGGHELRSTDPDLAAAIVDRDRGEYSRAGERRFFARHSVAGTEWAIVVSVSKTELLAPVGGLKGLIPWLLFGGFAAAALMSGLLIWRLADQRTHLATSNRRLAESNAELRKLDRLKDEFVALVSHELRTPLTSIIGYISALQRGRAGVVPAEQRALLDVADRNAKRLLAMIGDLLMTAKADAGRLEIELETLELGALGALAVESARPHADQRAVGLELIAATTMPVVADRARLSQVLDNLISNAIKFTPAGGSVQVVLRVDQGRALIQVRDDGIGIPSAEQAQLFQRFFRASTATSREIPGSGLGLSIVRTIVNLHDGTIECQSAEGAGTTFLVSLPLAPAAEMAA